MRVKPTVKGIFEQLNRLLEEKVAHGKLIQHNLESGLGTERAVRALLEHFLPLRFGVAKGKVINHAGELSGHCDVIIYDRLNCPTLYIDENRNQILPIEGVYAVMEIKTTLTKHTLSDAFSELRTVFDLQPDRPVRSTNEKVDLRPPSLTIMGFQGVKLETLKKHFVELNTQQDISNSFSSYSRKSPGYSDCTGATFMVQKIACLGEGTIYHMLSGEVTQRKWGDYTLGMFLISLLADMEQIPRGDINIYRYFNYLMIEYPDYFDRDIIEL